MVDVEFLQSHSLFGGVSAEHLEKIRPRLKEEHYKPGQVIIREGETGNSFYLILDGTVEVVKSFKMADGSTIQHRLAELGRGATFGEMELIDIEPRTATVRAMTAVSALSMSGMDLYEVNGWSPQAFTIIIMNLAREISRRLRRMDAQIVQFMFEKEFQKQVEGIAPAPEKRRKKPAGVRKPV